MILTTAVNYREDECRLFLNSLWRSGFCDQVVIVTNTPEIFKKQNSLIIALVRVGNLFGQKTFFIHPQKHLGN
jgi:hypothetical protein